MGLLLFQRTFAHQQVLVRLPVLGAHDHVNDRIDARGQVDEDVRGYVQDVQVVQFVRRLANGDRQVARDKRREYHEDHFQQLFVLRRHPVDTDSALFACPRRGSVVFRLKNLPKITHTRFIRSSTLAIRYLVFCHSLGN